MTDQHDPLDALASAHLDGHTTPEEAVRVATDPDLSERLARFETARAALRATAAEPIDPVERDAAIAAALSAFDESGQRVVRPLAQGARRSWWTQRRTLGFAAVAAAVVLLALAAPLLGRLDRDADEDVASVEDSGARLDESAPAGGAADTATQLDAAEGVTGAYAAEELGSFADLPALAAAVRERLTSSSVPSTRDPGATPQAATTTAAEAACAEATTRLGPVSYRALATLDGQSVLVLVPAGPDGPREIVVLDRTGCSELARTAL